MDNSKLIYDQIVEQVATYVKFKQVSQNQREQEMQQDDDTQEELTTAEVERIPKTVLQQIQSHFDQSSKQQKLNLINFLSDDLFKKMKTDYLKSNVDL